MGDRVSWEEESVQNPETEPFATAAVMARLHVTCPGPGNTRIILSVCHQPLISHDNLTFILLDNIDIHIWKLIH